MTNEPDLSLLAGPYAGAAGLGVMALLLWRQHRWFHQGYPRRGQQPVMGRREAIWRARLGFAFLPAAVAVACLSVALLLAALAVTVDLRFVAVLALVALAGAAGATVWCWKEFDSPSVHRHWPPSALEVKADILGV